MSRTAVLGCLCGAPGGVSTRRPAKPGSLVALRFTRSATLVQPVAAWAVGLVSAMVMSIQIADHARHYIAMAAARAFVLYSSSQMAEPTVPQFQAEILHSGETATTVSLCYGLSGRLVQLARTLPSHGRGHRFESCNAHQIPAVFFACLPVGYPADVSSLAIGSTPDPSNGKIGQAAAAIALPARLLSHSLPRRDC